MVVCVCGTLAFGSLAHRVCQRGSKIVHRCAHVTSSPPAWRSTVFDHVAPESLREYWRSGAVHQTNGVALSEKRWYLVGETVCLPPEMRIIMSGDSGCAPPEIRCLLWRRGGALLGARRCRGREALLGARC